MAMSVDNLPEFPVSCLLPRKETGILSFLSKYPKYDGSGIIIAVFDSGVDPAAPGLQVCSNGAVKVLDRLDGSGSGDVDTSTVVRAQPGGVVTGVTGRTLKIPSTWTNPSGEFHLGVKSAYSLYPSKLKDRLIKERKEQVFEPQNKKLQEAAMRRLQEKQRSSPALATAGNASSSPTEETDPGVGEGGGVPEGDSGSGCCTDDPVGLHDTSDGSGAVDGCSTNGCASSCPGIQEALPPTDYTSFLEKQQKEEAEAEVALLTALHKKYQDIGPAYDCVVFHDGVCWRACLDTSECGALDRGVLLGEYRVTHEWAPLTPKDNFTVTINVHNDGSLLEIVGMCSSHGTHVASIAASYFPDNPERNGVAPGAQIVSITLGDNRVQGMETGTTLSRAMSWVMDNPYYRVDVINMSYGEHSHSSMSGRLGEMASDVVNKYGVIWVASASNHGPALSTVGCPPDFHCDCIMGIGAYISPDMMRAEYSIMDKLPGTAYTWSSRGPTTDGGRGVSVCAPGGAITSMPAFTNKTAQLMNGTSMASPHAAGCVSLILSGLKQQQLRYTPYTIRRALQYSAQHLPALDPFVQGHGLIQVEKAFEHLISNGVPLEAAATAPPEDSMRFVVECGGRGQKGIYLRNWLGNRSVDVNVTVEPVQFDDTRADDAVKRRLNLDLVLTCDAAWVTAPDCLHMSYTARTFMVRVNPLSLERGHAYMTSIRAFVAGAPQLGPLFEVPVTVVMPILDLEHGYHYRGPTEMYHAGRVRRTFLRVPEGASWAHFTIKSSNSDQSQRMTLHAVQLFPQCSVLTYDHYKTFSCLYPNEQSSTSFAVSSGLTLELCVARWWASLHDTTVEFSLSFHGIRPYSESITIFSSHSIQRMDVVARLRTEEMWPQATIKHHVQSLLPYESHIEVLGGLRDTVPVSRPIYQLVLSYTFSLLKNAEVQPKCGLLSEYLYESAVESQLWMVFDSKKQLMGSGDAYSHKYTLKLDKGDYVIRQHVRHEKTDMLEKMQEMPMTVITKLAQEVKLDVYGHYHSAFTSAKKMGVSVLQQGEIVPLFIALPNLQEKAFKSLGLSLGHVLAGTVSFAKEEQARRADTYPLRIVVTEAIGSKKRVPNFLAEGEQRKDARSYQEYSDALRDLQVTWITKLDNEASDKLYRVLCHDHNRFLQTHVARLHTIDSHFNVPQYGATPACTFVANSSEEPLKLLDVSSAAAEEAGDAASDLVVVESNGAAGSSEAPGPASKENWGLWRASVTEAASAVQKCVDLPGLLAYLGTKMDIRADAAKFKTQMDRQRVALIDAFCKQGMAVAFPYVPPLIDPQGGGGDVAVPPSPPESILNELDAIATTVMKLVDPSDAKPPVVYQVCGFFVSYYQVRRLYGTAARLLFKQLEDRQTKEACLRIATLYRLLGYHHIVHDILRSLPLRFPDKYVPF